jgi:hypothetical protein
MLAGLFRRKAAAPDGEARARVAAWARAHGAFPEGTALTVSEIACPDPSCPGDETVILVMAPGARTRAVKVLRPLAAITEDDVRAALAAEPAPRAAP